MPAGTGAAAVPGVRPAPPRAPQPEPHTVPPRNLHAELVDALANGRDTADLTRRALAEAGPEGLRALETIDKYGTKVVYAHGGGSFYRHPGNAIHVDVEDGKFVSGVVHEATHTKWAHQARPRLPAMMGRATYIKYSINEETDATVREVYANTHLQTNGHVGVPNSGLQKVFTDAYNAAVKEAESAARAEGRVLTPDELAVVGDVGGRTAVYEGYHNGLVVTSTTGQTYPEFYGAAWDAANS
jgi:hypothetical protein